MSVAGDNGRGTKEATQQPLILYRCDVRCEVEMRNSAGGAKADEWVSCGCGSGTGGFEVGNGKGILKVAPDKRGCDGIR